MHPDAPLPGQGPRHGTVTPDDHGSILIIIATFSLVVMVLTVIVRLIVRFTTSHIPGRDDTLITFAAVFGIAEVVAITLAVNQGLGKRSSLLTEQQILDAEKIVMVATILYIVTIGVSKASTIQMISRLADVKISVRSLSVIVTLFTVGAIIAVALQCHGPQTWNYSSGQCLSATILWSVIGSIDILIDLALIALPVYIVTPLRLIRKRKATIMATFAFRFVVIAAQIVRIAFARRLAVDPIFASLPFYLTTQIQMSSSVTVACLPALKPFIDRAESGVMLLSVPKDNSNNARGLSDIFGSVAMRSLPSRPARRTKSPGADMQDMPPARVGGRLEAYEEGLTGRDTFITTERSGSEVELFRGTEDDTAGPSSSFVVRKKVDIGVYYSRRREEEL